MSTPRDPIFEAVHAAFLPDRDTEAAALARIRESAMRRATAPAPARRPWLRRRQWTRARLVLVACAIVVLAGAAVAIARTGVVQRLFTSDTPAGERMAALQVTPRPGALDGPVADDVPPDVERTLAHVASNPVSSGPYGTLDPEVGTRHLLDGRFQGRKVDIWARPTTTRTACFAYTEGEARVLIASQCFDAFFDLEAPALVAGTSTNRHVGRIFGVAADEVTGVTIRLADGSDRDAIMGANSFYWGSRATDPEPVAVVLGFADGHTVVRPYDAVKE